MARLLREDGLARLSLSGRALGKAEADALSGLLAELLEDRSVRLLVLDSEGADFCPGVESDLGAEARNPAELLAGLPIPVLAVLAGAVRSAGLELALAADIRIGGEDATFGLGDVEAGRLPSWGGTQRLPRIAGRSIATAMILFGRELDAREAFGSGLVQYLADDPRGRAATMASELLALSPLALAYAKEAVNVGVELSMDQGMRLEGDLNSLLAQSADRAEGLAAFFEKRKPSFQGR